VIIPFRDQPLMTVRAALSLQHLPVRAEVVLVNNGSTASSRTEVLEGVKRLNRWHEVRMIDDDSPFNFQRLNNDAARTCRGEHLLFMNNDAYLVSESERLVQSMVLLSSEPDIGCVGATLLFPDERTIQHGGVRLDAGSFASHLLFGESQGDHHRLQTSAVSAVTAAFLMVAADKFWSVDGLDERFIVCGGDVDVCLRMLRKGLFNVVCRDGFAVHDESSTRDVSKIPISDFIASYHSYVQSFDAQTGDLFVSDDYPYGIPLGVLHAVAADRP
jgi:GT2 family glycosyltransferase